MHMQTPRKLVDLDWDAMETEELNGSVCRCIWGNCGVRSTAQGILPSSSHGVFSSNHLCQQTSQSPLTAAADAWGAALEYKWRLNNEVGWCCLRFRGWPVDSWSLFIISDEHLIIIGTQIWFQITIFWTDCLHFHFATNEMWFFYLDSVSNTRLITVLFLS